MNILIVYLSEHETTKNYAKYIQSEVSSDIINVKKCNKEKLSKYDIIVFGSRIYNDKVDISDYIIENYEILQNKKLILYINGLTNPHDELIKKVYETSIPKYIRENMLFFSFGGYLTLSNLTMYEKLYLWFKRKKREANWINTQEVHPLIVKLYNLKVVDSKNIIKEGK